MVEWCRSTCVVVALCGLYLVTGLRDDTVRTVCTRHNGVHDRLKVIYNHDAGIDDYTGTLILAAAHRDPDGCVDFLGEVITNGDGVAPWSMQLGEAIHGLAHIKDVPLGLSDSRGYNAFPWVYREDCIRMAELAPSLPPPKNGDPTGDMWLENTLHAAPDGSITLVCTAGLTTLVDTFKRRPELVVKVRQLVWMGGAIHVPGNLDTKQFPFWNHVAEWNVYFDPAAAKWLFANTRFPIALFPLDIADQTPITPDFMERLKAGANRSPLANLTYHSYALVQNNPFYKLWDTVATAFVVHPEWYQPATRMNLTTLTRVPNAGQITHQPPHTTEPLVWREVDVYLDFAPGGLTALYEYIVDLN